MLLRGSCFGRAVETEDPCRGGAIPARPNALRVRVGFFFFLLDCEVADLAVTIVGLNLVERLVIARDTDDIDTSTRRKERVAKNLPKQRPQGRPVKGTTLQDDSRALN